LLESESRSGLVDDTWGSGGFGSSSLLLVEDEAAIRRVLCDVVRALGLRGGWDRRGRRRAGASGAHGGYDLARTDLFMPGLEGWGRADAAWRGAPGAARTASGLPSRIAAGYSVIDGARDLVSVGRSALLCTPFRIEDARRLLERARLGDPPADA